MNFDIETFEFIDKYLQGELDEQELLLFNQRLENDHLFASEVKVRKELIDMLATYDNTSKLKEKFNSFHNEMELELNTPSARLFTIFRKQIRNRIVITSAAAACISAIVVLSTLYFSGWFSFQRQVSSYLELKNNIENMRTKQQSLWTAIFKSNREKSATPSGTCFSVTSNGYMVTNFHVVKDVDSIIVVNYSDTVIRYNASLIFKDEVHDLAILKIEDKKFKSFGNLPYTIKQSISDLGENVFTLGYSKKDMVYSEGYISSFTGYNEDSSAYQASIPVNPGNSGSPLLNSKGEIIGIVSGKHSLNEGATFAIKSNFLMGIIDSVRNNEPSEKVILPKKNELTWIKRTDQVRKLHPFIFKVEVYK